MSLTFATNDPAKLLSSFKKKIDDGHVVTWAYDKDGDFTHNTDQWKKQAWLRPAIYSGSLQFNIVKPKEKRVSGEVYAIYHGRFIETMLAHCDSLFTDGRASAGVASGDSV